MCRTGQSDAVGGDWDAAGTHDRPLLLPAPRHVPQASAGMQTHDVSQHCRLSLLKTVSAAASKVGAAQSEVKRCSFVSPRMQLYGYWLIDDAPVLADAETLQACYVAVVLGGRTAADTTNISIYRLCVAVWCYRN